MQIKKKVQAAQHHGLIALSIPGAAKASNLSRSRLYEAIKAGELETLKVGARRLVMVAALEAWLLRHRDG